MKIDKKELKKKIIESIEEIDVEIEKLEQEKKKYNWLNDFFLSKRLRITQAIIELYSQKTSFKYTKRLIEDDEGKGDKK